MENRMIRTDLFAPNKLLEDQKHLPSFPYRAGGNHGLRSLFKSHNCLTKLNLRIRLPLNSRPRRFLPHSYLFIERFSELGLCQIFIVTVMEGDKLTWIMRTAWTGGMGAVLLCSFFTWTNGLTYSTVCTVFDRWEFIVRVMQRKLSLFILLILKYTNPISSAIWMNLCTNNHLLIWFSCTVDLEIKKHWVSHYMNEYK